MGDGSELLKRLKEEFGGGVAVQFSHSFAGAVLYVPGKATATHRIAKAMGLKVMAWIVEEYGNGRLTIPVSDKGTYKSMLAAARRAATNGTVAPAAARQAGVSQRTIHRHRAKLQKASTTKGSLL